MPIWGVRLLKDVLRFVQCPNYISKGHAFYFFLYDEKFYNVFMDDFSVSKTTYIIFGLKCHFEKRCKGYDSILDREKCHL